MLFPVKSHLAGFFHPGWASSPPLQICLLAAYDRQAETPGCSSCTAVQCHCPAVCRAAHMAISAVERADRQLHPSGNVHSIIRKHCIRIGYSKSTIKPLPQAQPLSQVQGYFLYWFVCREWFCLFFQFLYLPLPPVSQNAKMPLQWLFLPCLFWVCK